jgi:hypothetical protein
MTDQEGHDYLAARLAADQSEKWNRTQTVGDVSIYSDFAALTMAIHKQKQEPKITLAPAVTAARKAADDFESWLARRFIRA